MFKEKVNYEAGDLEFYQKMWRIDPESAKTWIVNRLNTLVEIQEYIKDEIKQLRDMSNYNEDKKILDYYNATGGGKRRSIHGNKEIIMNYMRENLNRNVRTADIIHRFLSLGITTEKQNVYNVLNRMIKEGTISNVGRGLYSLPETDRAV